MHVTHFGPLGLLVSQPLGFAVDQLTAGDHEFGLG